MYLVELRPGKEELYRSVDELAAAIRSGDVDIHSRIFHRATSKWISITLHPQFKAIAAARESEPPASLPQKQWTFLTSTTEELRGEQEPTSDTAVPLDADASAPSIIPSTDTGHSSMWRRSTALGMAGLLLIAGVQIAFSVPRPRWPQFDLGAAVSSVQRSPVVTAAPMPPRSSVVSLASTADWGQVGYPLPAAKVAHAAVAKSNVIVPPAPPAPAEPLAPSPAADDHLSDADRGDTASVSAETLIGRYEAAYDEAHGRLQSVLRAVQLAQLFTSDRLASADSLGVLRMNITGAENFVRAYRRREIEIERTHQDTFAVVSRQLAWPSKQILRWYGRTPRNESSGVATLTEALLASADSMLAVLAANSDGFRVTGASIAFDRQETAAEYGRLRQQFERQLESARAARAEAPSGALAAVLDALGAVHPPIETPSM